MALMMKPALLAAGVALLASPAAATEWIYCGDATNTVTIGLLMGHLDVLNVSGIILSHGDRVWASSASYGPGEEVGLGQGFEDNNVLYVDLMDKDFVLLAELRLLQATEGDMPIVYGGTLRLPGQGAWAVSCEGP
jgi:hypothetical protein